MFCGIFGETFVLKKWRFWQLSGGRDWGTQGEQLIDDIQETIENA